MTEPVDNNANKNGKAPFWKPWGVWGYLWRTLLFLAGILLICFLVSQRNSRPGDEQEGESREDEKEIKEDSLIRPISPPGWDTIYYPEDPYDTAYYHFDNPEDSIFFGGHPFRPLPPEIRDGEPVEGWGDGIPGVPELPDPRDNRIPPINPYDSTRFVPNPLDSLSRIVKDQLVVFFNSKDLKADMASFAKQFKEHYPSSAYSIEYYNADAGTMLLVVPPDELIQVMNDLPLKIKGVDFKVTINEILNETFVPTDPGFKTISYDEYFKLIQAYQAWDITKGSADVKVAIVDSYFDLTNPEIGERYVDPIYIPEKTKNVLPPSVKPANEEELALYCHGTHVAGIAIGAQDNKMGCSGIAPQCTWIPIALGHELSGFNVIEGIMYAVYHGADVVNVSLGRNFNPYSNSRPGFITMPFEDQVEYSTCDKRGEDLWEYVYKVAIDHNCVICSASGNEDFLTGMDPMKRCEKIIRVEAVDNRGIKADFSNFGIAEDEGLNYSTVAAPGVLLWSATPRATVPLWKAIESETNMKSSELGLLEMSGTSMASPVVAGAVALLKSKNKELTVDEVINILRMTAKQTDKKNPIGPTIQIRDALDATGGEKANFDELMKNHDLLIGKWKSTEELDIFEVETNEKIDEAWCYFIFSSSTKGTIEWHNINRGVVQTAPLTVKWNSDSIEIIQHGPARSKSSGDSTFMSRYDFICRPNSDRLLESTAVDDDGKKILTFMLEKVY